MLIPSTQAITIYRIVKMMDYLKLLFCKGMCYKLSERMLLAASSRCMLALLAHPPSHSTLLRFFSKFCFHIFPFCNPNTFFLFFTLSAIILGYVQIHIRTEWYTKPNHNVLFYAHSSLCVTMNKHPSATSSTILLQCAVHFLSGWKKMEC